MKKFDLLTQFLKNVSFESPNVPELFFQQDNGQAKMEVGIDIQIKSADNDMYMVDLHVKLHSLLETDSKTIFAIESIYTGLVHAETTENEEELKKILLIEVPTMLFPSVKMLIEQIIMNSGFPPFKLQQVDFKELYESKPSPMGGTLKCELQELGKKLKSAKCKKIDTD